MGRTKSDMMWLTPRVLEVVEDYENYRARMVASGNPKNVDKKNASILSMQVTMKNWQTPEARNNKGYHTQKDGSKIEKLGSQAGIGRLNASWVEQLMGLGVGWTQLSGVTDPNENRVDRLRLLGNGVVPQTAEVAFRTLLNKL